MFKLQSPSKYSPFDAIYLLRWFSHCSKQFLNLSTLMLFRASAVFCFSSFTLAKHSPLKIFSIQENLKKSRTFGQEPLKTQHNVGRCTCKLPIRKWANGLSLQKNSLKLNAASHNNASWYTDTDGSLKPSLSRGRLYYKGPTLQKIISVFWGVPLIWSSHRSFVYTIVLWAISRENVIINTVSLVSEP